MSKVARCAMCGTPLMGDDNGSLCCFEQSCQFYGAWMRPQIMIRLMRLILDMRAMADSQDSAQFYKRAKLVMQASRALDKACGRKP